MPDDNFFTELQCLACKSEWGKFYPNWKGKVMHANESHKNFYPEELSKKILFKDLLDF